MASAEYLSQERWLLLSTSAISVVIVFLVMRGVISFLQGVLKVLRLLFVTKYKDAETQTEPYYPELPGEIFINPRSEVFHMKGCHHVGVRATSQAACTLCRNRF